MKGEQYEEHRQKDCAHHGQQYVAGDEQRVDYLLGKEMRIGSGLKDINSNSTAFLT